MNLIKDDKLVESYLLAVDLKLEDEFLHLLRAEMSRRNIRINQEFLFQSPYEGYAS